MFGDTSYNVSDFNLQPKFYLRLMSAFSCLGFPVNLLGLCVIFRYTPEHLKTIRCHVANQQLWATLQDFLLGFCIAPVFFLPMPAGCPTGFFATLSIPTEVQFCMAVLVMCLSFSSVSHVVLYKWQLILPNHHLCKLPAKLKMAVSSTLYFSVPIFCIFATDLFENQQEQKKLLAENYPIYEPVTKLPNSLVFYLPQFNKFTRFLMVFGAIFGFHIFLIGFLTWSSIVQKKALEKYLTSETDGNTKQYVKEIKVQLAVMMGTLLKPGIFIGLVIFVHIWNAQELIESAFFLVSISGLINTISMFCVEPNYRQAAKYLICKALGRDRGEKLSMDGVKYRTNEPPTPVNNSQVTILET
ncbi:unnamed protein product, partial [Mesorhabditis belari]|uniref:G protein-coupled receptor n=1 Tax=Mesorhabditis belari TaxID=2138241 RepID=A0AAF3FGL2_9BILA